MGGKPKADTVKQRIFRFVDKNLQLALLDEVHDNYAWIQEEEARYEAARGSHPTWPTWEAIRNNDLSVNLALEKYLLEQGVPAQGVESIESLTLGGERNLYGWIHAFWWDEGDHFVIRNLSGIEKCKSLRHLSLDPRLIRDCSLAALAKCQHLESVQIRAHGNYQDLNALSKIPRLKKLEVLDLEQSVDKKAWNEAIRRLLEKGLPSLIY